MLAKRPAHKRHGRLWGFPGGKLAFHENHLAAAKRELGEELGLKVESVGRVLFKRQNPGSEFLIQFIEIAAIGEPEALEHEAVAWVSVRRIDSRSSGVSFKPGPGPRKYAPTLPRTKGWRRSTFFANLGEIGLVTGQLAPDLLSTWHEL